ncbi:uncharacterized protein LOC131689769 [Topomyia yanbarensis]|uniref:uncharacterized protein LOC131689769 n=1 Tax=Topomyia yanbarensis TaxID=2498891 RepID=UPI00273B78AE|nr:uncharacterized protein LOC131689769 [Topomyia yanbarensis]
MMSGSKSKQKKQLAVQAIQQHISRSPLLEPESKNASTQTESEESTSLNDSINTKLNKIFSMLSHLNTKVDALAAMPCQHAKASPNGTLSKITLQPVQSLADLERLEENCRDENFVKITVTSIGRIHGRHRYTGRGATVSLQIIDYFFARGFLVQCSWTGSGRTSGKEEAKKQKIPFMKFDKTIDLFYQTVLHSDPTYTVIDCKAFLHRCLRNAKQRFDEVTGARKPVSRKRKRLAIPDNHFSTEDVDNDSNVNDTVEEEYPEETVENRPCSTFWKVESVEIKDEYVSEDV